MKEMDDLIKQKVLPFREKMLKKFAEQHAVIYTAISTFLGKKRNKVGLQVTAENYIVGSYTFVLEGVNIVEAFVDTLEPAFEVPLLGSLKMYAVMEKKDIEKMLADKDFETGDILTIAMQYLPSVTIKFTA